MDEINKKEKSSVNKKTNKVEDINKEKSTVFKTLLFINKIKFFWFFWIS
jgi:hypothetical protein